MLQPTRLISTPFAQEGEKTQIQNVTGEFDNSATYRLGFPPLTMQSIRLGGKPPKGTDFNGVLFDITENISFLCKGGRYQYNAGLSTLIGGYPDGSNLLLDDNVTEVVSTVAGNQNNPNTNMAGWILKPNKTTAANVADASGETQQQVNYNGGSKWHSRVGGYQKNERVVLTNGDIVKSTIDGNVNDPNVGMVGWVKTNDASQIFDESGKTQQEINNSVTTQSGETVKDALYYVTTGAEAIVGDGSDESAKLSDLLVAWDGHVIDFRGQTVSVDSELYVNFAKPTTIRNGKIKYIGTTNVEAAATLTTTTKLILENFNAESTNASKTLRVLAASDSAELEVDGGTFKGGKQKTGFGFAAGLHIARLSAGFKFKRIVTNNVNPQDIDSEIVNGVGRGVYVSDFEYAELNNTKPERVGPYYDGDGIFAQENNTPGAKLIINGAVGIDCQKRVVKSQVVNSTVTNITAIRTQAFPFANGQSEVSLQSGGSLDGLYCFYADGAAPNALVNNIGGFGGGLSGAPLKNITVVCANPNNIINKIVGFEHALADTSITGYELSHVSLNCRVNNIASFYSAAGMTAIDYAFKDVIINDIKCTEILSDAFVVQRGVAKYVRVSALISNIAAKNGKANLFLLDPTAGTTTWLFFYAARASNIRGINIDSLQTSVDTAQRVFTKSVDVNENAAANLSFNLSIARGGVKVIAIYNPNRDSATANLYTEGMVFNGQSQVYYVETTAGNKSQAGQGALSIAVSGRTVTLSKTAGTLTGGGRLQLMLIHSSLIDTE